MTESILSFIKSTFKDNKKAFLFYATRWQLSTPIFVVLGAIFASLYLPYWESIIVGNLVGATIFFPIDRWIVLRGKK